MPGPLPRWLTGCSYPFLPLSHRPSPKVHWVGCTTIIRSTTSERVGITRLQSFDNLQASEFAATQVVPTAGNRHGCQGGRGVYIRAERGSLSPRASDILAVRNRAIDGRGLSPPRSAALLAAPDSHPLDWQLASLHAPHLPDAGRQRLCRSGQTRDLPASDAILLHVMWPWTPAARQHLAKRCRTCCLRANRNPRPLRHLIFRGSIPHPTQSLCTLRNHPHGGSRNTRYQADATPYLGRTSTGWIAPACLAHLFDPLVCDGEQNRRHCEAQHLGGRHIEHD